MNKALKWDAKYVDFNYPVKELNYKSKRKFPSEANNILLGNSGTPTNNHINIIKKLNELNLDDISQNSSLLSTKNFIRKDSTKSWLNQEEALQNAPAKHDGFFSVPKVIK